MRALIGLLILCLLPDLLLQGRGVVSVCLESGELTTDWLGVGATCCGDETPRAPDQDGCSASCCAREEEPESAARQEHSRCTCCASVLLGLERTTGIEIRVQFESPEPPEAPARPWAMLHVADGPCSSSHSIRARARPPDAVVRTTPPLRI